MPSPEKLTVFSNPEGKIKSLIINPEFFSLDALRSILWHQSTSENPKDILAINPKAVLNDEENTIGFSIPHATLLLTKCLRLKERSQIINTWARIMKNADHVVISAPLRIK